MIFLSQNGPTTFFSKSPSDEALIATARGVITIKRDDAKQWRVVRKSLEQCHISSLMQEPTSGLIFAGVHTGTIYASGDGGKSWEPKDKGITHKHVFSLNHTQVDGKVKLYAGTEPAHLFESDDLGESWHELPTLRSVPSVPKWTFPGPPHVAHVKNVTFDPRNSRTIYASIEVGGLLKSTDGGETWEEFHGFFEDVHRLVIRPSDPNWFYITGGDGLYHSRDGGKNWDHLTTRATRIGYPDALLIHPHHEDLMFMAGAITAPTHWRRLGTTDTRIALSRDAGRSWEMLHEGFPEHIRGNFEAMVMDVWDGTFSLFAGTTDGEIYFSDAGGERWSKIVEGLPPIAKYGHDQHIQ